MTVTAWHAWDGPREPLMKTIFERLKGQYPNLTVEQSIVQLWMQANVEKLGAAVAAGTAPDVIDALRHPRAAVRARGQGPAGPGRVGPARHASI